MMNNEPRTQSSAFKPDKRRRWKGRTKKLNILLILGRLDLSLVGKTLFISGASRGIGLAIALRAARDKANIAIAAKTATPHPTVRIQRSFHTLRS